MEMDSKTHLFPRAGLVTNSPGGKRVSQDTQEVALLLTLIIIMQIP